MTHRHGLLLGGVLGVLASLAGCGPTRSAFGTSLFITTRWNADAKVWALYYVGQVDGRDAFPRSVRPEKFPATPLTVPEKVRVLLADDLVGQSIEVSVYGYDQEGTLLTFATAKSPPIIAGDEVVMTVLLDQAYVAADGGLEVDAGTGADAGPGPGPDARAGIDAGTVDAGGPPVDGGVRDGGTSTFDAGTPPPPDAGCGCGTTCCTKPGLCTTPVPFKVNPMLVMVEATCGPVGSACQGLCDPLLATSCEGGQCRCGNKVCGRGQRCAASATGGAPDCVCDTQSQCQGCCNGASCVNTSATSSACGNAGNACSSCSGGATCTGVGVCVGGSIGIACVNTQCKSGEKCVTPVFPTCRSTTNLNFPCVACDLVRSDRCGALGQCMCGLTGSCAVDQFCDNSAGLATCAPLPR